jgi:hypothetical protein
MPVELEDPTDDPGVTDPTDPAGPTGPEGPGQPAITPRIGFAGSANAFRLYERDRVSIHLLNRAARERPVKLHLVSKEFDLLWTSAPATETDADSIVFALSDLTDLVPRGQPLLLTASVQDTTETWYFATDGSEAGTLVEKAAVRPALLLDGKVITVGHGAVRAVALAVDQGRVFYANTQRGQIGALKLTTAELEKDLADVGSSPNALAYRSGTLAALVGGGAELSVLKTSGGALEELNRKLLPPFFLRVVQEDGVEEIDDGNGNMIIVPKFLVSDIPAQPYARNLSLGCVPAPGGACSTVTAYGASGIGSSEGRGIMRRIPITVNSGSPAVVPIFKWPVAQYLPEPVQDTIPVLIDLISGTPPAGDADTLFTQLEAARCITLQLGAGPVVASPLPKGPVFAAAATADPLCGDGTRVVRIDDPDTDTPELNDQAVRNLLGEDRIGPISEMKISGDGKSLLLLGEGVVYRLDEMLRVRGRLDHENALAISWLEEKSSASDARFAVADPEGVTIYESERLTPVGRLALEAIEPHMMSLLRDPDSTDYLVVSASHNGSAFVLARMKEK